MAFRGQLEQDLVLMFHHPPAQVHQLDLVDGRANWLPGHHRAGRHMAPQGGCAGRARCRVGRCTAPP